MQQRVMRALGSIALAFWICIPMCMAFRSSRSDAVQKLLLDPKALSLQLNDDDEYMVNITLRESRVTPRMAPRKPVIWLHLHKAGGTLMCKLAKLMNESVIQPETTCNLENHHPMPDFPKIPVQCDGVAQMGQSEHRMTCEERLRYYQTGGITWGQMEREYNGEDMECGDSFMYGIMLREPMSLVNSDLNFNHWHQDHLTAWLQSSKVPTCDLEGPCKHSGHPELGWQLFDNFIIRSLTGTSGWWKPPGTINETDLETAKSRLEKMDLILILEELSEGKDMMEAAFGWRGVELMVVNKYRKAKEPFTPQNDEYLSNLNRFDSELYKFAQNLSAERRKAGGL